MIEILRRCQRVSPIVRELSHGVDLKANRKASATDRRPKGLEVTLKELEARYGAAPAAPPEVLRQLGRDPRAGARRLYRRIERRMDRARRERARLEGMFRFERVLWNEGVRRVAGVDEVGIGPMAGPVVAAAVIFRPDAWLDGIDDSKRIDPELRDTLNRHIRETALGVGVGVVETEEVDRLNVYRAGLRAMQLAVEQLDTAPDHVLVDSRTIPNIAQPQSSFDKGDSLSFSIAAASIVAKVYRDNLMAEMDRRYPGYGFAGHKGYCTPEHCEAVQKLGPCSIHRRSFDFIRELCGEYSDAFYELLEMGNRVTSAHDVRVFESRLVDSLGDLSPSERRKLRLIARRRRDRLVF